MTIWLVRHGHAGNRSAWHGDDDARPLSAQGRRQADAVRATLADRPVGAVLSSPSRRCVETVATLAADRELPVVEHLALAEGGDADRAIGLAVAAAGAGADVVVCSHGDVIPAMLRRLTAAGMRGDLPEVVEKGSVWELEVDGTTVQRGTYHGVPSRPARS